MVDKSVKGKKEKRKKREEREEEEEGRKRKEVKDAEIEVEWKRVDHWTLDLPSVLKSLELLNGRDEVT